VGADAVAGGAESSVGGTEEDGAMSEMDAADTRTAMTAGEIYETQMVPAIFARWAPELVAAARPRPGERVLDIACGTGVVTRLLYERVAPNGRVVGLDLNAGMLAAARTAAHGLEIEWLEGNATNLSLPDGAFEAVVCQQGLQFFPDKVAALREMHRVLIPAGRLAVSVFRSVEHTPGYRVLQEALARHVGADKAALPPFSLGDGRVIRDLMAAAGFREIRVRADVKLTRFQSAEHFIRSVIGGGPSMLGALAEQGPRVLDTIVAEVAAATVTYLDDEGWATAQVANIITALA
jgi:ubiquinone/menaquinone biosynthesis C-methylase UbiE